MLLKFIKKYLILIITISTLIVISAGYAFSKSLKKEPKIVLKKAIENIEKEFINTNDDFIPIIDNEKFYKALLKDGNFTNEFSMISKCNKSNNIYKINSLFKRELTAKKALSDIYVSKNDAPPIIINNRFLDNKAYLHSENIDSNTYEINLSNYGEELLNSDLLSKEYKDNMDKKDIENIKNIKLDLFVYPNTLGALKDYYLSFVDFNLQEMLNKNRFKINDAPEEIKEKYNSSSLEEYNLEISYFDFKYLLLSTLNFYENLISTYSISYNIDLDENALHASLRERSEEILDKYQDKGIINAKFYINESEELLLVDITKTIALNAHHDKYETNNVLKLSFNGEENLTDNIELEIFDLSGEDFKYNRTLEKNKNSNKLLSNILIDNEEIINSKSTFNEKSKEFNYNLNLKEIDYRFNKNIAIDINGVFSDIKDNAFTFNINSLNYINPKSDKHFTMNGKTYLLAEKPVIVPPKKSVDIFSLNYDEFNSLREKTLEKLKQYIDINPLKIFKI